MTTAKSAEHQQIVADIAPMNEVSAGATGAAIARPHLFDTCAWRDALVAWVAQRVVLAALTYLVLWKVVPRPQGAPYPTWGEALHVWTNWDSAIYASIATHGYQQLRDAAFFPLFPALERLFSLFTGGNATLAGLLIANGCCLVAFALLRVLVEREYGRDMARRTLLYLTIFPFSLFLAAAYSEALFLLLSVAAFLALRRQRWWLAGIFAALATLTRPVGILLIVPLAIAFWQQWQHQQSGQPVGTRRPLMDSRHWYSAGLALLLPFVALAGFSLALAPRFGTLAAPTLAQSTFWGRHLSWPWDGIVRAGVVAVQSGSFFFRWHATLDVIWTLLFIVLALATLRRLPLPYAIYACATAVLIVLTPMHIPHTDWAALASNGRFLLVVFPVFMLLARWGEQHLWFHRLVVTLSLLFSLVMVLTFIAGSFVA